MGSSQRKNGRTDGHSLVRPLSAVNWHTLPLTYNQGFNWHVPCHRKAKPTLPVYTADPDFRVIAYPPYVVKMAFHSKHCRQDHCHARCAGSNITTSIRAEDIFYEAKKLIWAIGTSGNTGRGRRWSLLVMTMTTIISKVARG